MTESADGSRSGRVQPPSFVRQDGRGTFVEILNEGPWETIIHGEMHQGAALGDHYHRECRAFFYLISGKASVAIVNVADGSRKQARLSAREGLYLLPFESHRILFEEAGQFVLLKSYRYDPKQPDMFHHPV